MIFHKRTLFAVAFLIMVVSGCGDSSNNEKTVTESPAIPVKVVTVVEEEVSRILEYSGTVEPWAEAALGSEIPGRLEYLHCDVGDVVSKDSLLAELGSETLIQARSSFSMIKKDWNRIKTLRENGTVSQQTYDQTKAAFDAAKAAYEKTLASTQIRAPFTGTVTQKFLDEGEVFTLFPGTAGSPAIIKLMQLDTVKVKIAVTESEYPYISIGQKAKLTLDSYPDTMFEGEVSRIAPTLNTRTRTADVEVMFVNPTGIIKPGMFGLVRVALHPENALLVNRDVLIKQEGTGIFYVYKVESGKSVRSDVVKGNDYGDRVEIVSGLQPNDTVITAGKMKTKNGSKVKITSPEGSR